MKLSPYIKQLGYGLSVRILFDTLAVQNAEKDFINRQISCLSFFVGVPDNPYAIIANSINDVPNVLCVNLRVGNLSPFYSTR